MSKAIPAHSNTRDPAFLAKWEPYRYSIRPPECDIGEPLSGKAAGHTCWVRQPYESIPIDSHKPRCKGCGGIIEPRPPRPEAEGRARRPGSQHAIPTASQPSYYPRYPR